MGRLGQLLGRCLAPWGEMGPGPASSQPLSRHQLPPAHGRGVHTGGSSGRHQEGMGAEARPGEVMACQRMCPAPE